MRLSILTLLAALILAFPAAGQEKKYPRMPKQDWSFDHGVWLASAAVKGGQVEVRVSVPMFGPRPGLNGKDPQGPEDFVTTEMRAVLKASEIKVTRKNGTVVRTQDLPQLLSRETYVLWWNGTPDPYYLTVMREDVLILDVPMEKVVKASAGATPPKPSTPKGT